MALDNLPSPLYVAFQGLETYFVDKDTGEPLSGGYVEFYKDVGDRSATKDVYQQVRLSDNTYQFVNIGHVVNLTAVGTFESPSDGSDIQVYAFPYEGTEDAPGNIELYHLKVYSSGDILQFTRDAQPANVEASQDIDNFEGSENIIENCQFVKTLLNASNPLTISVTGVGIENEIAPDWSIVTSGTGSVTITQQDLNDLIEPTGAPFAINISSTGIDSLILRQQITQSPRILGHGYASASLVAKSFMSNAVSIIMNYTASNGYSVQLLNQNTTADGYYNTLINEEATLIDTTNTNPGSTGYVNIDIVIPAGQSVGITSVQVVSTLNASSNTEFIQVSTPRQIDHLFHYYKPQLEYKPIPSYLTAWDFPLNPGQQLGSSIGLSGLAANKSRYIADQTISFESVGNVFQYTLTSPGGLTARTATNSQFAIIQYLDQARARELLTQRMCVQLRGYLANIAQASITGYVSLYWTANGSLPNMNTNDSLVSALTAGVPTVVAGWNQVGRSNLGRATFTFNSNDQNPGEQGNAYSFSGWDETSSSTPSSTATFFAIVISFDTLSSTVGGSLVLDYCSLQGGDIPTRPAPQTTDEVLRECQYYYETSYNYLITPGTVTQSSQRIKNQNAILAGGSLIMYSLSFNIDWNSLKRAAPSVTFYSPNSGNANEIYASSYCGNIITHAISNVANANLSSANWTLVQAQHKSATYIPQNTNPFLTTATALTENPSAIISFHYVADARFGIV